MVKIVDNENYMSIIIGVKTERVFGMLREQTKTKPLNEGEKVMFEGEKRYVYSDRGYKAIDYAKMYLRKGITPMIAVDRVKKSKVYKEVDKFLIESGCKRVLVEERKTEIVEGGYSINPTHYEYVK